MDGSAQHLLAGAHVLLSHPRAVDDQSRKIIHQQEQERSARRRRPRVRHVWTDQHVADPQLVRPQRFEATKHARLLGQGGAVQTAVLEMLANGAFGHTDAVACQQDGADLCGGACRQLHP